MCKCQVFKRRIVERSAEVLIFNAFRCEDFSLTGESKLLVFELLSMFLGLALCSSLLQLIGCFQFTPSSAPFGSNSSVITLQGQNFDRNRQMLVHIGTVSCKIIRSSW